MDQILPHKEADETYHQRQERTANTLKLKNKKKL